MAEQFNKLKEYISELAKKIKKYKKCGNRYLPKLIIGEFL